MTLHHMTAHSPAVSEVADALASAMGSTKKSRQHLTDNKKNEQSGEARKSMDHLLCCSTDRELHEELRKLLGHLHAQTMLISGEGMENFFNHNDQIKSDYLWSMCDTAERAMKLLDDAP